MKNISLAICLLLLGVAVVLIPKLSIPSDLSQMVPRSRIFTLRKIVDQANQGNYFQLDPGIPMEVEWEDPGMGVTLSLIRFFRSGLRPPFNRVELQDIYAFEIVLLFIVFLLPYSPVFKWLPAWYYLLPPLFLIGSWAGRFLLFEWTFYSMATCAVLVTVTTQLNLYYFTRMMPAEGKNIRSLFFSLAVVGFVLGFFGLFRRNVHLANLLILSGSLAVLFLSRKRPNSVKGRSGAVLCVGLIAVLFFSSFIPRKAVSLLWAIRDHHQHMSDVPRNPRHPFWHALYMGLGYVYNEDKIQWDDRVGYEHARRVQPNVVYASAEYEKLMRTLFLEEVIHHPTLLIKNVVAKTLDILAYSKAIPAIVGLMLLVLVFARIGPSVLALMGIGSLAWWSLDPLVSVPEFMYYSMALFSGTILWGLVVVFLLIFDEAARDLFFPALQVKKLVRSAGMTVALLAGPVLVFGMVERSLMHQPVIFLVAVESRGQQIFQTEVDLTNTRGANDFTVEFSKQSCPITSVIIRPMFYLKNNFQINQISLYDDGRGQVKAGDLGDNREWWSYHLQEQNMKGSRVYHPRLGDFAIRWNLDKEIQGTSLKLTMSLLAV